jgi:methylthioribose-1-phosphate isomerase
VGLVGDGCRILTHCNTGALVSAGEGTAFAIILAAHRAGRVARLWVDETRPLLQGARLTAYEAGRAGIPHTVLADSAAASLMAAGEVDLVLTGADRIAADGSVANKVGTYGLAVLARHHDVPFVVVAPSSTVDRSLATGAEIAIEERAPDELRTFIGTTITPPDADVFNPAFDVTPAELITAVITEHGRYRPTLGPLD